MRSGELFQKAIVVCLGNPLRGDDAFGLLVYRLLKRLKLPALYAGFNPEIVLPKIRNLNPDVVIVVDALRGAGRQLIVTKLSAEVEQKLLTTHTVPLSILFGSIGLHPDRIVVVGAEAENVEFGCTPSERIRSLAVEAAAVVVRMFSPYSPGQPKLCNEGSLVARCV